MRTYHSLFLVLCLPITLTMVVSANDSFTCDAGADKIPLFNLKQFPLPPCGIGYHAHDCPEEASWTLCTVFEIQEDKQLKPYSGQLNWEAYDSTGKVVYNSCCTQENFLKAGKNFMQPGDVFFVIAEKDGEVFYGMPRIDSESAIAHFSAIPIWTYNESVHWCPLFHDFCWECNKLQAEDFSRQSIDKNGQHLHNVLNMYVPAKSTAVVTKAPSGVSDVPVYYVISNKGLSASYKTSKRTDEKGSVDFRVHREKEDLGFYALHGGCLHPSTKKPGCESVYEIELYDNVITLVLKKGNEVLSGRKVVICDEEVSISISGVDLMSDETGQIRFIPPKNATFRILVFDSDFSEGFATLQTCVSLPIRDSEVSETIIFDLAGKNEVGTNRSPVVLSATDKKGAASVKTRFVFPEPRQLWKDIRLTAELGVLEDKSRIREFNVHRVLEKSRMYIDNQFTLAEILSFDRVLFSLYYTGIYEHSLRSRHNVQPTLAPGVP